MIDLLDLLTTYGPALRRIARLYAGADGEQDDLHQEILLQLWRGLPSFRGDAAPGTWLYRVALNTALTWRRRAVRHGRSDPANQIPPMASAGGHRSEAAILDEFLGDLGSLDRAGGELGPRGAGGCGRVALHGERHAAVPGGRDHASGRAAGPGVHDGDGAATADRHPGAADRARLARARAQRAADRLAQRPDRRLPRLSWPRSLERGQRRGARQQRHRHRRHRAPPDRFHDPLGHPTPPRPTVAVDPAVLERYMGRYELTPAFVIEVTREGDALFVQATGQPRFRVYATSPTRFFLRAVEAEIAFTEDASSAVTGLVLSQAGRETPGRRVPKQE